MKTLITAVALTLTTLTSFAQEATPAPEIDNFVSTRTRAEVQAELRAAIADGWQSSQGEASRAPEMENFVSTLTRAEVRGELMAAIARGERLSYGEAGDGPQAHRSAGADTTAALVARGASVAP